MKVTIESTDKIVNLRFPGDTDGMQCRVWEGETECGVKIHCFIPWVWVAEGQHADVYRQFEKELAEKRPASREVEAIPFRMLI